jgi:zona occludens toxin
MAVNALTGVMGSGKTFEGTASILLPAILAGRDVVTNIDGINEEKIHAYLVAEKKADITKLGHVRHVKNEDIAAPNFFPDEEDPNRPSIVKGGDLVMIDEAWRFWGQGEKISTEHMQFFRMHRHYVHPETKVSCDICLMVQAIGDLNRSIRAVVEMTLVMTKLKTIGMNKSYRVEMYEGGRTVKTSKFETYVKRYDKKIFPLYQSYAGGAGNEKAMDKRQNVLKNPRIWLIAGGMLIMCIVSGYYVWWFFKGRMSGGEPPKTAQTASAPGVAGVASSAPGAPAPSRAAETFRIVGEVTIKGERWVAVSDQDGRIRLVNAAAFVGRGFFLVGNVEGQRVTTWTGPVSKNSGVAGMVK